MNENETRTWADRAAIGLSGLCALHCLLLPVALTVIPSIAGMGIADEAFHVWMIVLVVPISAFALFIGCRKHRQLSVLAKGGVGLAVLISAPLLGHDVLGEVGEKTVTLVGAMIVAWSHLSNYRLCQEAECNPRA
ncbi:MAG: MerC domain-containing protein [Pseudomonadota bacterium]